MGIRQTRPGRIARRLAGALAVGASLLSTGAARAELTPDRVLLLYNSANAESLAVRDAYIGARPGVLEFDLADPDLTDGSIDREAYLSRVRAPLLAYLAGTAEGVPLRERVIAIATTRGLPARIDGAGEFSIASSWASLESELTLAHQDLEADGAGSLASRFNGPVRNPYHQSLIEATAFDRSAIAAQRAFTPGPSEESAAYWLVDGLTPGDIYLVCRLDAPATPDATAVENVIALIQRSLDLSVDTRGVQALLDEYSSGFAQLDADGIEPDFPAQDDFDGARAVLESLGVPTTHDESFAFVTGADLPHPDKPLLVLGTYGENHSFNGWGEGPPGAGTYITTLYDPPHPAAVFVSYESFNGNSIVTGTKRGGQGQALDFIGRGGSFTIAHVAEPFTFAVADLAEFTRAAYAQGLSFAEAAYMSIPALSWQSTPVGDPLARVEVYTSRRLADLNADGVVDGVDLGLLLLAWGTDDEDADLNDDGVVDGADLGLLLLEWGAE